MKEVEEITPNYAPVYAAALYPQLANIFQKHGYALAVHGSLARDFDIIAVPWGEKVSSPDEVIKAITDGFVIHVIGEPDTRNHGRVAYTISVGFGECALDLSFFPNIERIEVQEL
jgi:hypothetical protein